MQSSLTVVLYEFYPAIIIFLSVLFLIIFLRNWLQTKKRKYKSGLSMSPRAVVGFFHPYCNAGGGGERVLWVAIRAIQKRHKDVHCVVYTGDCDATAQDILQRARQRFNIILPRSIDFIFLKRRRWVEANMYPFLTLLGQSLGSLILGWEALTSCVPDIYIDSMGYAFTLPLFRYFGKCVISCYVHYPTISTDMLQKVSQRQESHNNRSFISQSWLLSNIKILYYRLFAFLYGWVGRRCDVAMVNSSWTYGHIKYLWQINDRTHIVYPPCDIKEFMTIPLENNRFKYFLSISQFRPEKDHPLQIISFHKFLSLMEESQRSEYKLLLVGSCRNSGDQERVEALQDMCKELGIADNVQFKQNVSFDDLKNLMSTSMAGLHSMWNEHFGIGVVELMAAGCIVLAHDSGGPKLDIVVPTNGHSTGFLAADVDSYTNQMTKIMQMNNEERLEMQVNARSSVNRFSDQEFESGFLSIFQSLVNKYI